MCDESNKEIYIDICKMDSQWEFAHALYQPRGVGLGGSFKREMLYVYLWRIHVEIGQKTTKFCKAIMFFFYLIVYLIQPQIYIEHQANAKKSSNC